MNTIDNNEFNHFKKLTNFKGDTRARLVDKIEKYKQSEQMSSVQKALAQMNLEKSQEKKSGLTTSGRN